MRGTVDVLASVVMDLRDHDPLVDILEERQAIYESNVTDDRGYPAEVTVTPIYEGSTPHRGVMEREYRVQVTIKTTYGWREARDPMPGGHSTMQRMLGLVGERLDRAKGIPETSLGAEGGPEPLEMDDGRLAVIGDWRVAGWYLD